MPTGVTLSSLGITSRSAVSRAGSDAPMTVRKMISRVISDIFGATGKSVFTGHVRHVGRRDLGHHDRLPGDRVAVEGGQHLTPSLPVHVVVDHQHGAVAEQAAEHRVRFACVIDGWDFPRTPF